jgi:hypothetical protein
MGWIYLAVSVDWPLPLNLGSEPFPIVKITDSARASCCPECGRVTLRTPQSGMMCGRCVGNHLHNRSTLSPQDFLARISPSQELEQAWEEADRDYFSRSFGSLASFDPSSFSWKTSQLSLFGGLTEFSWNSMHWGMMRDGQLFQPQRLEPRTFADESSFLPTPAASEYGSSNNGCPRDGRLEYATKGRPSLGTMARKNLWPTPRASDGEKGSPNQTLHGEPSLAALAARFPTPTASMSTEQDMEQARFSGADSTRPEYSAISGGSLNPEFVEWLMGFPIGWTVLADWAMEWYRKRRAKRSSSSTGGENGRK